jgi:hypothetical protein
MMSTSFGTNGDSAPGHLALIPADPGPGTVVIQQWWRLVPHVERVVVPFNDQPPEVCDAPAESDGCATTPGLFRRELNPECGASH